MSISTFVVTHKIPVDGAGVVPHQSELLNEGLRAFASNTSTSAAVR